MKNMQFWVLSNLTCTLYIVPTICMTVMAFVTQFKAFLNILGAPIKF